MEFILSIILGLIFCLPMIWVAKLKIELNITNYKLDFYRNKAVSLNHIHAYIDRVKESDQCN